MEQQDGSLQVEWVETDPGHPLAAKVLMVVRPPKIFDEEVNRDIWQMED